VATIGVGEVHVLQVGRGEVEAKVQALKRHPEVAFAEPNYILHTVGSPNDAYYPRLWGLKNTGQTVNGTAGTVAADIKAEPAWGLTTGSASVVIGVVDTGVGYNHPDLAANIWSNPGGVGGCPAGTHGYNALAGTCDPMDDDDHGSHVSGTIGAVGNNGTGVVGVNWQTSIIGLKFLDSTGSGTILGAVAAIDFAVRAKGAGVNVRVLSASWGGTGSSQTLLNEIVKAGNAGILFVTAAGNSAANVDSTPFYPCAYTAANLICVAATDQRDGRASFSNYGATSVDLGAPGVNILSTVMPGTGTVGSSLEYDYYAGTSMATPHVAGAAALILSAPGQGALTVGQLRSAILNNVDPIPSLAGITVTGGRLDVCKAIPGCGAAPKPDFSLVATPASRMVAAGTGSSYTGALTSLNGYDSLVNLSVSGLPAGATASFSPNPVTPTSGGATSTLSITTAASTPVGSYPLTVIGTGTDAATTSHTATVSLVVTRPDFTVAASPSSRTVQRGAGTSYGVTLTALNGYSSRVNLSVRGLPTGATSSFSANPVTPTSAGASSTLSIVTAATTPAGTYTVTITGTGTDGSSTTHSVNVTLVVGVSSFSMTVSPSSRTISAGWRTSYTAILTAQNGYSSPVTLRVSGLPTGATASFSANSITPQASEAWSSLLTVTTRGNTPRGTYKLTMTGTGSDATATTRIATFTLVVR
jgi:hypothetical protein